MQLLRFSIAMLCVPLYQPIRSETKRDLLMLVFLCLVLATYILLQVLIGSLDFLPLLSLARVVTLLFV